MANVVGRERELSAAERFLDSAVGCFAVLLLEGASGVGKTTVWREVIRRAEERGFFVLSCRAAQTEAKLSLSAVADLLGPVPEAAFDHLHGPQRRALDVALLRTDPGNDVADQRTVGTAVRSLLAELALETPVLVAVDDLQWLDTASAATLEFVLRRLRTERIGFVASRRLSEPSTLDIDELVDPEGLAKLTVGPLTLAEVHHLLRDRFASPLSRSLLIRIHEASGGNALFAIEIGRLLDEVGVPAVGEPLPVPDDVQTLVRRRIATLPAPTREVLLTASALDNPRAETVRVALGRAVETDFEPAEREQIAQYERDRIVFTHPLFAAAILATASANERRRIHRLLANAVEGSEARARHLALAGAGRDEPTAIVVHAAARDALFRGAPAAAAELAELALRLSEPDSELEQLRTIELADYLYAAGESRRAREVLEAVPSWEGWSPRLQARGIGRLCALVSNTEREAQPAIEFQERLLRESLPGEARAAVHSELSYSTSKLDAAKAALHADAALELLEPIGDEADPGIHAGALYVRLRTSILRGEGLDRGLVDRIRALEGRLPPERRMIDPVSPGIAYWLRHVDDLDAARTWLERMLQQAVDSGNESAELHALVHLSTTECWAGNLEVAHRYALSALHLAGELNAAEAAVLASEALALADAHLGNVDEVHALAERQPPPTALSRHGTLVFRAALGLSELSLGHHEEADVHLRAGLLAAEKVGCREPGVHRMHANAAEVALALGDLERAKEIGRFLEQHGERTNHPWSLATGARVRALVAAACGDLDEALTAVRRALEFHDRLPMPFEHARTLLAKAAIERRTRRRSRARESLEQALEIFERIGARLWVERTRTELDRLGLRRASRDELTESERRVAELAARGLTNRDVAAALFVSPKTVEANLSRVYQKLGIKSRAELGARAREFVQT